MHVENSPRSAVLPPLPTRAPTNQSMAATLRLWGEGECYDRTTIQRCLEGLRSIETARAPEPPTVQNEIDGVIARWRAGHYADEVRRAS